MRLRMYGTPVSADEGGYLAIARAWSHGRVLYRDVWVDRPQGLLLLFRFWDWVSGGSTASIRIMAMIFGVVLVVATTLVVRELVGATAAQWTAVVCGIVSAAPVLEGHTANGELLSGAVSAAAIAVAALADSKQHSFRWYAASGAVAGLALSLKQSGFDGILAVLGWLALVVLLMPARRRFALRAFGAVLGGLVLVVGAMALQAALTSWSRWWSAVAGYRLSTQSAVSAAQWINLRITAPYAVAVLGACTLLGALGVITIAADVKKSRRRAVPPSIMLVLWSVTASLAFLVGGGYWRHYWLLLAAPASALAGVGIARLGRFGAAATLITVAPCLFISIWVFAGNPATITIRAASDKRSPIDERVAQWYLSRRVPGENLFVLCASSAVYADAHQDPGYPYLWYTEVIDAPQSQNRLVAYLDDPTRAPEYIAQYQGASACDRSGRVARILHADYRRITAIGFVTLFERSQPAEALLGRPS